MTVDSLPLPLPKPSRRIAAVASYVTIIGAGLALVLLLLSDPLTMLAAAALLAVAVAAAWNALTRRRTARLVSAAVAVVAVVACIVVLLAANDVWALVASLGLAVAAVALGRYSLARDRASLISAPTPGVPVPPATQPVLIMNLKSGGGKAEKFKLADECRARGIEPVVLQLGDDLVELAEARDRTGCRRDRDGGRRRVAGLGRIGRRAAGCRSRRGACWHAQPLRARPRTRSRRCRRRARCLRSHASRGASTSPRSTAACSSTTCHSASTGRSPSPRSTATRRLRPRSTSCRRCSAREESPPTSAGRGPMACTTSRPTSSRCRTTGTACGPARAPEPATDSTTESSASSPSKSRAPRPQWSWPRSSPCGAPTALGL